MERTGSDIATQIAHQAMLDLTDEVIQLRHQVVVLGESVSDFHDDLVHVLRTIAEHLETISCRNRTLGTGAQTSTIDIVVSYIIPF